MAGTRLILPRLQFFDGNGSPLSGGKLNTYQAGTTTPLATYTDSGLGTPNANPVVLDSDGYASDIFADPDVAYKIVLTKSDDSAVWTADNIYFGGQVGTANIEDDAVTGAKLASAVAGAGLAQDGSGNLKIEEGGNTISVSSNDTTPGVLDGKLVAGDNITLTEGNDGGDETLTVDTSFRGALVYMSGNATVTDGSTDIMDWDTEEYDTSSFHEGVTNPDRLTIPANVSRVRVKSTLKISGTATTSYRIRVRILKNGAAFAGMGLYESNQENQTTCDRSFDIETAVVSVSATDYFTLEVLWTDTGGAASLTVFGSGAGSFFALEVVE